MDIIKTLSEELNIPTDRVEKTVALIDEGNTIPFIARYRKEITGSLDDIALRALFDRLTYLRKLDERRAEIANAIENQGKLTEEITHALSLATTLVELEDIYRPYKQKRRTRASIARERGLTPLAELILSQPDALLRPIEEEAAAYIDEEKGVADAAAALAGASDIIAEDISDNAEYRKMLRDFAFEAAVLETALCEEENEKTKIYADYAEYREQVKTIKGHRVLAITRGEREECLRVNMTLDREGALARLGSRVITNKKTPVLELLVAGAAGTGSGGAAAVAASGTCFGVFGFLITGTAVFALAVSVNAQHDVGKLFIVLEKNAVGKKLKALKDLTFSADDASGIVTGDLDHELVVFLFDSQVAFEAEIVEHGEQSTVELLFLLVDFGVGFFGHFRFDSSVVESASLCGHRHFTGALLKL